MTTTTKTKDFLQILAFLQWRAGGSIRSPDGGRDAELQSSDQLPEQTFYAPLVPVNQAAAAGRSAKKQPRTLCQKPRELPPISTTPHTHTYIHTYIHTIHTNTRSYIQRPGWQQRCTSSSRGAKKKQNPFSKLKVNTDYRCVPGASWDLTEWSSLEQNNNLQQTKTKQGDS